MRSSERHQLKQDQFAVATQETIDWAAGHRNLLLVVIIVAAVVIGLGAAGFYYQQNREQKASLLLGQAVQTFQAPIRPAGAPPVAGQESYTSAAERAQAAAPKFAEVDKQYSHTDAATFATYFLGLTAQDQGDNGKAESYLKKVADSGNKDIAALAKSALASLYHDTGRDQEAINLYQELIQKPTNTVTKPVAQINLAQLYEPKDPAQARKLYEEVVKENANNELASVASQRLQTLGK